MVVHQVWDRDSQKVFSNGNETLIIVPFSSVLLRSPPFCVISARGSVVAVHAVV